MLNGPYHSFGTRAEEPSLFKVANRQHVKNAVEVCEYNVAANLYEMRAGKPWRAGNSDTGADAINAWMPEEGVTPEDGEEASTVPARGKDATEKSSTTRGDARRVVVVGPENFEKNFASRAKHAAFFDVIVVGAWSAQRVTPALGATAKRWARRSRWRAAHISSPWTPKRAGEFAGKREGLAVAAGFAPVPASAPEAMPAPAPERDPDEVPRGKRTHARATGPGVVPELDDSFRFFVKDATPAIRRNDAGGYRAAASFSAPPGDGRVCTRRSLSRDANPRDTAAYHTSRSLRDARERTTCASATGLSVELPLFRPERRSRLLPRSSDEPRRATLRRRLGE